MQYPLLQCAAVCRPVVCCLWVICYRMLFFFKCDAGFYVADGFEFQISVKNVIFQSIFLVSCWSLILYHLSPIEKWSCMRIYIFVEQYMLENFSFNLYIFFCRAIKLYCIFNTFLIKPSVYFSLGTKDSTLPCTAQGFMKLSRVFHLIQVKS